MRRRRCTRRRILPTMSYELIPPFLRPSTRCHWMTASAKSWVIPMLRGGTRVTGSFTVQHPSSRPTDCVPAVPNSGLCMSSLALNPARNHSPSRVAIAPIRGCLNTCTIGKDSPFLASLIDGRYEVRLSLGSICEKREMQRSFMFLPNSIPSHARSLLRGILPWRPAARRRSAFPVPSGTSLRTGGRELRPNFFRPAPKKALLGTWEHGPTPPIRDPS